MEDNVCIKKLLKDMFAGLSRYVQY